MNKLNNFFATVLATLALASCAVGPNYRAPTTAPAVVKNAQASAFVTQSPEALWWQEFGDTELDDLVRRALAANLDLRSAYDQVRAARAVFVLEDLGSTNGTYLVTGDRVWPGQPRDLRPGDRFYVGDTRNQFEVRME